MSFQLDAWSLLSNTWIVTICGGIVVGIVVLFIQSKYFQQGHHSRSNNKKGNQSNIPNTQQKTTQENIAVKKTANILASRLRQIFELMNEGRTDNKFQVAELADTMGLSRTSELESYLLGIDEPTFEFIEKFSDCFGVNLDWLKLGKGQPFTSKERSPNLPEHYFQRIMALNPKFIFFVKDNTSIGQATIALQLSEWKWVVFPTSWHISSHVGGSGRVQLHYLYELILKFQPKNLYIKCWGRILNEDTFQKLLSGQIFPGSVLSISLSREKEKHWWDDFRDIYHEYSAVAKDYPLLYGDEFVNAQLIVRDFVEYRPSDKNGFRDFLWEPLHLEDSEKQPTVRGFNLKNIRALLIEGFTDEELRRLCYDEPDFRPVYDQLAQGMGKDSLIDKLVEYAERRELIEILLALAKERNPTKYERYQPYHDVTPGPTTSRPPNNSL